MQLVCHSSILTQCSQNHSPPIQTLKMLYSFSKVKYTNVTGSLTVKGAQLLYEYFLSLHLKT